MAKMETSKKRILLVEDDEILVDLLVKKLQKAGYEVEVRRDGASGLEAVASTRPDLVLLDMMLPRLSGFKVIEKLNAEKILPELPLVIVSNSGQPIEVDRALALGARDYLVKVNFDPNEVLEMVNRILKPSNQKPAEDKKPEVEDKADPPDKAALVNVLIIEDDTFLVDLLEKKFKKEGYSPHRALDAKSARTVLENKKVDLILLDVVLPGMDGFTFLAELKSNDKYKNIPVIIISNLGQREEMERGLKSGAIDYIVKAHVTPGEIVAKSEEVIKKVKK